MERLLNLPTRIVEILAMGEPIPRLWALYFSFGAITFGLESYPAEDVALLLIPLFILSGVANLYGCTIAFKQDKTLERSRKVVCIGMMLMIMASWTRGVLVWGLEQHGVGNRVLASTVWAWITVGSCFLLIGVWQRGLR